MENRKPGWKIGLPLAGIMAVLVFIGGCHWFAEPMF